MNVLVTVGTTEFDLLINVLLNETVLRLLKDLNVQKILLQIGRSQLGLTSDTPFKIKHLEDNTKSFNQINTTADESPFPTVALVNFTTYLPSLMQEAQVLICHAGAGTLLEALSADCKILTISNPSLMRNHQIELGAELARRNYVSFMDGQRLIDPSPDSFMEAIKSTIAADQSLCERQKYRSENKQVGNTFLKTLFESELE